MFHRLIVFLTDVRCDGSTDELRVGPAVLHTTICTSGLIVDVTTGIELMIGGVYPMNELIGDVSKPSPR